MKGIDWRDSPQSYEDTLGCEDIFNLTKKVMVNVRTWPYGTNVNLQDILTKQIQSVCVRVCICVSGAMLSELRLMQSQSPQISVSSVMATCLCV